MKQLNIPGLVCAFFAVAITHAFAQGLNFGSPRVLSNREVAVLFQAPSGQVFRVDAATNLTGSVSNDWRSLLSFQSSGINQHTDSAAPFSITRFYRAEQLTNALLFTGDHLSTTNGGDIVIRPINHASFVMSWNGKVIYNDPVGGSAPYAGLPKADLILVSHNHGDHFNSATIDAVRGTNCVIVAPRNVTNSMSAGARAVTAVLTNSASTNVHGIQVEAVPAYNGNHPVGAGNGYVLTMGGRRLYIAGDTGNTPEMRALTNIDVAFLCMNVPFTMTPADATNAVRAFRPAVVYPYHYRDQSGATTNAAFFKSILGLDTGIEVRLRKWY
jgi:L-ascorbate metabolism protein UlaG (beta-lactamase superfamily)